MAKFNERELKELFTFPEPKNGDEDFVLSQLEMDLYSRLDRREKTIVDSWDVQSA